MTERIVIIIIFIVLGILLFSGKGSMLIAGYNTMPVEKKRNYDEKRLGRSIGYLMFVSSGCMIMNLVGEYLGLEWIKTGSYIIGGVIIVITLIYVNVKKTPIKKL